MTGEDKEMLVEHKLAAVTAPDNGTTSEVLAAVLECARAWVPEARIIGNVRAGDIARAVASVLSSPPPSSHVVVSKGYALIPIKPTDEVIEAICQ
uniref:hypothetical protein n=1 Tax=Rhizobium sp. SGZ-381 TaxID=3342800 RepID=UPI00366DAA7C